MSEGVGKCRWGLNNGRLRIFSVGGEDNDRSERNPLRKSRAPFFYIFFSKE